MKKTVIIGTNHAGIAAANTLLDNYSDQQVVMIDKGSNLSYLGCGSALRIGRQIEDYNSLFYTNPDSFIEKGATIHMETIVESIDFNQQLVMCQNKEGHKWEETYDNLVLATGSKPIKIPIPGIDLAGIHCLKTFEDSQVVDDALKDSAIKNVAIVGAGYIGMEMVEAVKRRGKNVMLFDIAKRVLPTYYDEWLSNDMLETLKQNKIDLHLGEKVLAYKSLDVMENFLNCVEKFVASKGKVEQADVMQDLLLKTNDRIGAIETDKGDYSVDLVINALGFVPNVDLGKDTLTLSKEGAYLVNEQQQTNLANVYAIGDCASIYSNALNEVTYIALATNAVRSGIVAGNNIGGAKIKSIGVQGSNAISIFGQNMVSTGLSYDKAISLGIDAMFTD